MDNRSIGEGFRLLPVDENGNLIRNEQTEAESAAAAEKQTPAKQDDSKPELKKRPAAESEEAKKRKRPPTESEEPKKRKHPPTESKEPKKRKRPPTESEEAKKRKRPPTESEEPKKRKRPPTESEEPKKRKRPPMESEEAKRRKRPPTESEEPRRRKRSPVTADSRPVKKKKRPPQSAAEAKKRRNVVMKEEKASSKKPNNHNKKQPEEKNSSRGCMFPVFLLLICVVIFVASFSILTGFMQNHSLADLTAMLKGEEISEKTVEESTEDAETDYIDTNKLLSQAEDSLYNTEREGVVSQISLGSNTMKIYDIENKSSVLLSFTNDTKFSDENGIALSINKIKDGDMVIFVYNEDKKLISLKLDPDAEEYTSLAVTVNEKRKLITMGSNVYKYNKETIFRYKDKVFSPSDITEYDVVTVKAKGYDAWSVVMEKSHGTLKFTNYENIPDAAYGVDEGDFNIIPENAEITLTEGVHKINIKSPAIADFSGQVIIKAKEEAQLNLAGVQILRGSLIVDTVATGATLYVDGVEKSLGNPMFLNYGEHKLSLCKGSQAAYKRITIDKEQTEVDINFDY